MKTKELSLLLALTLLLSACTSQAPSVTPAVTSLNAQAQRENFYAELSTLKAEAPEPSAVASTKAAVRMHYGKRPHLSGVPAVQWANQQSIQQPRADYYDHSIMVFDFIPGDIYQVYCAPLNICDLSFEPGERIVSVAAGDTARWEVSKTYSGNGESYQEHLLIKPMAPDADMETGLVVTTDKRAYHLQLHSTPQTAMTVVKWYYPEEAMAAANAPIIHNDSPLSHLNPSAMQFVYHVKWIRGSYSDWMPLAVFTDGEKTYIQFPKTMQHAPILFAGHSVDTDNIINYRVVGNFYIVDLVLNEAQLRLGAHNENVAQITRDE